MRVAFYAPMKPPGDKVPSGDREVARRLIDALRLGGHQVSVASRLRSRDGKGDALAQARIAARGARIADELIAGCRALPPRKRPEAWFTYHLYHKAPDWLGPRVSRALGIPYLIAEASRAPKQKNGPWAQGYEAAETAIRQADAILGLNSDDKACILPLLALPDLYVNLPPFLDPAPFDRADGIRADCRKWLQRAFGVPPGAVALLTVAMMRDGAKRDSYRVLADAMGTLAWRGATPWRLIVVGDGPAARDVRDMFRPPADEYVTFAGARPPEDLPPFYAGADLYVWPAMREAYGMAMLEAQAAGLPVIAGKGRGVGDVVSNRRTGLLTPPGDAKAMAEAVAGLIADPARRAEMSAAARRRLARRHSIKAAARILDKTLHEAAARRAAMAPGEAEVR